MPISTGERINAGWESLLKPPGSLGQLESVLTKVGSIQSSNPPEVRPATVAVFAGDHGITEQPVSAFPASVTETMVQAIRQGEAAINVLGEWAGVEINVWNVGSNSDWQRDDERITRGTSNPLDQPAMTADQRDQAIQVGRQALDAAVDSGASIVALGEIGIGNTTISSVLTASILDVEPDHVVGRGTGVDDEQLQHKQSVVEQVIKRHCLTSVLPSEILRFAGGYEHAAGVGLLLQAYDRDIPVVLDGFTTAAAALLAQRINPDLTDITIAGHQSTEPGHRLINDHLELDPIIDLEMGLGEGTGAVLALNLLQAASQLYQGMGQLEDWVPESSDSA